MSVTMARFILVPKNKWRKKNSICCSLFLAQHRWINFGCAYHYPFSSPLSLGLCVSQEQQVVVYQMLQQQRQRELQRLTLTGALTSTPTPQSPNLGASPLQGGQGNPLFGLQENALHKPGVSADMQLFETPYLNRPLYMSILDQLKL